MDILLFPLLAHWPGTTPQYYLLLIGWQPSHREVKQLAQGYTISDEACSYYSFSHSQERIGEELLRGRQGSMTPSLGHSAGSSRPVQTKATQGDGTAEVTEPSLSSPIWV